MAKKATAPKLQEDIQTDEELNTFLERPGLLVLDIYSEWCGPCLGMVGSLRKLKLDIGGDNLSYAICKADTLEVFKRFRRKSEPTWLFVTNHKAVNIMFGSNVPKLLALISYELRLITLKTRNFYDLSEYQPLELKLLKIKQDVINKALAWEFEQKEKKRLDYLTTVTSTIMDNLSDMGVTIFGPQVNRDMLKNVLQIADQFKIQCKERKTVRISKADFETIHFECPNPLSDDVLEQLEGKELFVCYWKVLGNATEVPQILQQFAKELQERHTEPGGEDNEEHVEVPALLAPLEVKLEIELPDADTLSAKSLEEQLTTQRSTNFQELDVAVDEYVQEESAEEEDELTVAIDLIEQPLAEEDELFSEVSKKRTHTKKLLIPPIWVPNNHCTHAALIYRYFRNQTVTFLPPDPQPEPPYVVMAFDAYKKRDLILHADRHRDEVPAYGFFTSDDADEAEFIANSLDKYKAVTTNDKIVLKVKKATSHTMLQLVTYGPSYVSPNPQVGQEEVLKFFPPTYKTAEQELEEETKLLKDKSNEITTKHSKVQKTSKTHEKKMEIKRNSDKLAAKEDNTILPAADNPLEVSVEPSLITERAADAA